MGNSKLSFAINDPWLSEAISRSVCQERPFRMGFDHCIAVTFEGKIAGGVLFDNYLGPVIQIHVHLLNPIAVQRDILWMIFDYSFNALGVEKVLGIVPVANEKALKFDLKLGFKIEHTIETSVPSKNIVLLSMARNECKWLAHKPTTLMRRIH